MSPSGWRLWLGRGRPNLRRDIDDEMGFHLQMLVAELVAQGWSTPDARVEAARRFGELTPLRSECLTIDERRYRRLAWSDRMNLFAQDVRGVLRGIRRDPAFSIIVTVTLALGIGATTAIFSVLDTVILQPLPYADAARLVALHDVQKSRDDLPASYPEFLDWRSRADSIFTAVGAMLGHGEVMDTPSGAEQLQGAMVSSNYPSMLGLRLLAGRIFRSEEEGKGRNHVVLLGEALWRRSFGADRGVVGRTVTLTGTPFVVIGIVAGGPAAVTPRRGEFARGTQADFWIPLGLDDSNAPRGLHMLSVIAKLRSGESTERAAQRLWSVASALRRDKATTHDIRMEPLQTALVGDQRAPLTLLLGAVSLLLVIACANVANLLLARGATRRREFAVRASLGAGRRRLMSLVLLDSTVRSLVGGACGILLAVVLLAAGRRWFATAVPRMSEVTVSWLALDVALTASLLSGLLFGAIPALRAAGEDLLSGLRDGGRGVMGSLRRDRVRRMLVIAEMALSFVLLASGGLLARSFVRLLSVPTGFDDRGLVAASTWLPHERYPDSLSQVRFWQRLEAGLAQRGVTQATLASNLPIEGGTNGNVSIEGRTFGPNDSPVVEKRVVGRNYFHVLGATMVAGRAFADGDVLGAPPVVVINDAFAKKYFPGENPIGKRVAFSWGITGFQTVVGVATDIHEGVLELPAPPAIYIPVEQRGSDFLNVVIRSPESVPTLSATFRKALREIDPQLPLVQARSFGDVVAASVSQRRLTMTLLLSFALAALVLAAVGLYGVISYSVAQRSQELGIRAALGAARASLLGLVMRQSLAFAGGGIIIGALGAIGAGRMIAAQLFGTSRGDPMVLLGVAVALFLVAVLATAVPALRATRADPLDALRSD